MTPEQLAEGYAWCYKRLFSHASIWRRRPRDWQAVPPYLAMSYLYKRANWLWPLLIRANLTGPIWQPLIEWSRRRHVHFRRRSPLKGMRLTWLDLGNDSLVHDVSPLKGMPITMLNLHMCPVHDLSPLKGMPLST